MKKQKNAEKEKFQKFCPRCASTNICLTRLIADIVIADFKFYECTDCSWRGTPFEGTQKFIEQYKKKLKNAKKPKSK